MHIITATTVDQAYQRAMQHLREQHITVRTRNGDALVFPGTVTTTYLHPDKRVLWDVARDANPFFHLMEALWMLRGTADASMMAYLVPNMRNYMEPDTTLMHGAYGVRWWNLIDATGAPQLRSVINLLRANPRDRRVMLQMWDSALDLGADKRDVPCNTIVKFGTSPHDATQLNMTVFNRSNDIIWGCYGANAVHFSVLLEYVARMAGLKMGTYEQISCDWHAYAQPFARLIGMVQSGHVQTPYEFGVVPTPIVMDPECFNEELGIVMTELHHPNSRFTLLQSTVMAMRNRIFPEVVRPMMDAYRVYRDGDAGIAVDILGGAFSAYGRYDWLLAGSKWMTRRFEARERTNSLTSTPEE